MIRSPLQPRHVRVSMVSALTLLPGVAARAATWGAVWTGSGDCATGGTTFTCRLRSILHLLSVTAVVLGVLLLIAVVVAIWIYRRTREVDPLQR